MRRMFGFLGLVAVMYRQRTFTPSGCRGLRRRPGATNPQGAINITGVKSDLISIASAERRYFASEGKYVSLDELISTNSITVARQRPRLQLCGRGQWQRLSCGSRSKRRQHSRATPAQLSVDENAGSKTTTRISVLRFSADHLDDPASFCILPCSKPCRPTAEGGCRHMIQLTMDQLTCSDFS